MKSFDQRKRPMTPTEEEIDAIADASMIVMMDAAGPVGFLYLPLISAAINNMLVLILDEPSFQSYQSKIEQRSKEAEAAQLERNRQMIDKVEPRQPAPEEEPVQLDPYLMNELSNLLDKKKPLKDE